jgi:hypothetical protein
MGIEYTECAGCEAMERSLIRAEEALENAGGFDGGPEAIAMEARITELEAERDAALQTVVHDEGTIARLEAELDEARTTHTDRDTNDALRAEVKRLEAERDYWKQAAVDAQTTSDKYSKRRAELILLILSALEALEEDVGSLDVAPIARCADILQRWSVSTPARSEPDPSTSDRSDPSPSPSRRQTGS